MDYSCLLSPQSVPPWAGRAAPQFSALGFDLKVKVMKEKNEERLVAKQHVECLRKSHAF